MLCEIRLWRPLAQMFPDLNQPRRESLVARGALGFTVAGSSGGWGALAMLVPPVTADEWHRSVLPGLPTFSITALFVVWPSPYFLALFSFFALLQYAIVVIFS